MKKLLLPLIVAPLLLTAAELDYKLSAGYVYDSNIGQNITEVGKGFITPQVALKLQGEKIPLFLKATSTYENYLTERSPVLNSPFLAFSAGGDWKTKKFKYGTELRASLYYGQSAQENADGTDDPVSWASAKNSYRWYNDFGLRFKRQRILLNTQMQINNYGDNGKDGFRLILEPEYQYRFKVKKSDNIKVRYLSLLPEFEGNYVKSSPFSYNYTAIGAGANVKIWKSSLYMSISYATKNFLGEVEHPQTGEMLKVENNYFYTYGSLSIPIVADLSLKINGKLRFKESTNPSYEWNRHTVGAKLVWSSTLGKYSRGKSRAGTTDDRGDREEI